MGAVCSPAMTPVLNKRLNLGFIRVHSRSFAVAKRQRQMSDRFFEFISILQGNGPFAVTICNKQ